MSSSPQIVVDVGMCRASAAPKVGYMNISDGVCRAGAAPKVGYMSGSDGATPLCHVGTFSGAFFYYRRSLLISLRTRRCMPLTERLERCGGLFLDSASTLFFGGDISESGELPEVNSLSAAASLSPDKMGSLSLFCLLEVQDGCSLVHLYPDPLPKEPIGDRSLAADGQHGSAI